MKRPLNFESQNESKKPYKIYNNSCILECPANYMNNATHCIPCQGRYSFGSRSPSLQMISFSGTCTKECAGLNVDSITLARQLRGCTHITSSLEIHIRGGSTYQTVRYHSLTWQTFREHRQRIGRESGHDRRNRRLPQSGQVVSSGLSEFLEKLESDPWQAVREPKVKRHIIMHPYDCTRFLDTSLWYSIIKISKSCGTGVRIKLSRSTRDDSSSTSIQSCAYKRSKCCRISRTSWTWRNWRWLRTRTATR